MSGSPSTIRISRRMPPDVRSVNGLDQEIMTSF
jgi:hypothetical protein